MVWYLTILKSKSECSTMKGDSVRGTKKTVVLPWELTIEILLRLPVKSLVRFKCVCKSWHSLISDQHFATSHLQQPATHTSRLIFIAPSVPEMRSIDFNAHLHDHSSSSLLNLNFLPPNAYHNIQIIGSCRGFLLLNCCQSLWLWNPSTGSHKQVSCSSIESNMNAMFFTFLYGFGYDSSTDDYLVVKGSYNPISRYCATRMEFFSVRDNSWRDVEASHLSYMNSFHGIKAGSLLNGVIHWFAFCCDVSMNVIVAFDLTQRSFSEIPLPVDFESNDFDHCDLGVLGEFLSLSAIVWNFSVEIWVMEEYKVQSSWTKTTVVFVENIPNQCFSLICSTRGGDIVGTDGSTGLVKCNDKGELHEHRSYCNGQYQSQVAVYTESLLSLPPQRAS